jgi:hypothetical protein
MQAGIGRIMAGRIILRRLRWPLPTFLQAAFFRLDLSESLSARTQVLAPASPARAKMRCPGSRSAPESATVFTREEAAAAVGLGLDHLGLIRHCFSASAPESVSATNNA